jgi:hypothetical protein
VESDTFVSPTYIRTVCVALGGVIVYYSLRLAKGIFYLFMRTGAQPFNSNTTAVTYGDL